MFFFAGLFIFGTNMLLFPHSTQQNMRKRKLRTAFLFILTAVLSIAFVSVVDSWMEQIPLFK